MGVENARIPRCPNTFVVDAQIRCAFAVLVEAIVAEGRRAFAAGGAAGAGAGAGGANAGNAGAQAGAGGGNGAQGNAGANQGGNNQGANAGGNAGDQNAVVGGNNAGNAGQNVQANVPAFDATAARDAARADPKNRSAAIVLGAAHAAGTLSYRGTDGDFSPVETGPPILEFTPPAGAADDDAYTRLCSAAGSGWELSVASGNDRANLTPMEETALDMTALDDREASLAFCALVLGQAAPSRAGAELFKSGHHYLSDAASSRRHVTIANELFGKVSEESRTAWREDEARNRTLVWHSSVHFWRSDVLIEFAVRTQHVEAIKLSGFGSMAVGLPVVEDSLQRGRAYLAIEACTKTLLVSQGHKVGLTLLRDAVTVFEGIDPVADLAGDRPALIGQPAAPWPAGVIGMRRKQALVAFLDPLLARAEGPVAFMYGYFSAMCDATGVRSSSREGSLLRAWSLQNVAIRQVGMKTLGSNAYTNASRHDEENARKGMLRVYDLRDDVAEEDREIKADPAQQGAANANAGNQGAAQQNAGQAPANAAAQGGQAGQQAQPANAAGGNP